MKKNRIPALLLALSLTLTAFSGALADDNPSGTTVQENTGTIENNYGTVTTNTEDGTINTNAEGGTVNNNYGEIKVNNGTVNLVDAGGTYSGNIIENNGTVNESRGLVYTNNSNGTVGENTGDGNSCGVILENDGTVEKNYAFIQTNYGTVGSSVTTLWNTTAEIDFNYGTVDSNASILYANYYVNHADPDYDSSGTVTLAEGGEVRYNYGTLYNASVTECTDSSFGETFVYGTDTLYGVSYFSETPEDELPWNGYYENSFADQWVQTQDNKYTVLGYEDVSSYLGEAPEGQTFKGWKGSDGKTYKAGAKYSTLSPLELVAIFGSAEDAKAKAKLTSLGVAIHEDGSVTVLGGKAANLTRIKIDGETVSPDDYTLGADTEAGLPITFTDAFLAGLEAGEHLVDITMGSSYAVFMLVR